MALDEALLELGPEISRPVLRFYGWSQPAASFGYFQKIADLEHLTPLRPLVRRTTGGGLVPHAGDWTYSVIVPPFHPWYELRAAESYARMHQWIVEAMASIHVPTELAPCCRQEMPGQCFLGYEKSDVLWFGRKIAGAAQRRSKTGLLIQGSVQPPPPGVSRDRWQAAMTSTALGPERTGFDPLHLDDCWLHRAAQLADEKYHRDDYNRRR
jgi:lipoate-protein ligase A